MPWFCQLNESNSLYWARMDTWREQRTGAVEKRWTLMKLQYARGGI